LVKKEVVKREIELIGRTKGDNPCPVCEEADEFISSRVKNDNKITYKKTEVTDEIADKERIESIPLIKDCKIYDDGKKKCREIEGFDKEEDWSDL
jgi:hypothetical protein